MVKNQTRIEDFTGRVEKVTIETIDNFCEEHDISRIDLLKMDIQGFELDALMGASAMLKRKAIRFVLSEVAFTKVDSDMTYFGDLNDCMEAHGLRFCGLYDTFRYGPAKEFVGFSDALYVNSHCLP